MGIGNQIKTVILLGLLTGILLWVGDLVGGVQGLTFALIFAILINFGSYFWSDKIVLKMYKAKEVTDGRLHQIVREIVQVTSVPMPKVYVIPSDASNAFAAGRNPKNSAVAATNGILALLTDSELKGVMAHEITHITNRDTLISTVAATIAGVISYVAMMARWGAMFGGFGGRDNDGGNILELLVLAILTPILATLIQLAISRSREYLADAGAAKVLHSGLGLADALEKLEKDTMHKPLKPNSQTETTAHLMIINPFGKLKGLVKFFSTHPSTKSRVDKLRSMNF